MRILLVEDDPIVRSILTEAIELSGHATIASATYQEAMARLAESNLRGVITDHQIPGPGTGADICREATRRGLPCLIITGDPHSVNQLEDRSTLHLSKPFKINRVLAWLGDLPPGGA